MSESIQGRSFEGRRRECSTEEKKVCLPALHPPLPLMNRPAWRIMTLISP